MSWLREDKRILTFKLKTLIFTTKLRHNIDQVTLLFVVSQETARADGEDKGIHITIPSDTLRERKFTMSMLMSSEERSNCIENCNRIPLK